MNQDVNYNNLLELFVKRKVTYPEFLIVITSMLQHGLKDVVKNTDDPESPAKVNPVTKAENDAKRKISELASAMESNCEWILPRD